MAEPIVLLVEDNEDDILLARSALEKAGHPHALVVARNGAEAIAYLVGPETRAQTPAVVLLDLKLPKVDGKVVLRELRGNPRTARVPVVVLTSSGLEQDVLDAYVLGANAYYRKPLDFGAFSVGTAVLLAYWFRFNVGACGVSPVGNREPLGTVLADVAKVGELAPISRSEVVVIDGNADERVATLDALRSVSSAMRVRAIGTFEEAADFLRSMRGPPPDVPADMPRLILLDMDLPDGDSRDLLHALRYRLDHHVLLVIFTGAVSPGLVNDCYRLKTNSLVCKPGDPAAYRETVRILCHYWLGMNTPPAPPHSARLDTPRPG